MPRSKNPANYPESYAQLLQAAYARKAQMLIPMESEGTAARIRAQLYAYINAVEKQEDARNTADSLRMSLQYRQIKIAVQPHGNGFALELWHKAYTPENLAIANALKAFGDFGAMPARSPDPVMDSDLPDLARVRAEIAQSVLSTDTSPTPPDDPMAEDIHNLFGAGASVKP